MNKIKSRRQLKILCQELYHRLSKDNSGLLNEFFPPVKRISWTFELCQEEALKYKRKIDWEKASPNSYACATRNRWVDRCSKHMKIARQTWSYERCKKESKKYKSIKEWFVNSSGSLRAARKNGWYNDFVKNMKKGRWDFESCKLEALKYSSKVEWKTKSRASYQFAMRNKLIDLFSSHMSRPKSYNAKRVKNIDTGVVYDSIKQASRETNILNIDKVLCGSAKTAGGYRWAYCNEDGTVIG